MAQSRPKAEDKPQVEKAYAKGPRPEWCGPRPHVWKSGPDTRAHEQYQTWLVHKAQANFRGEGHSLSFDKYKEHWDDQDNWSRRGRASACVCMTRIDNKAPWSDDNVKMIDRKLYLSECAKATRAITKQRKENK